jgi:chaperonin GroES
MKLQAIADRLVVKPIEAQAKTDTGFFVPDSAKEKPQMGEVISAGKDVNYVKVGDKVVYSQYKPDTVKVDGQELMIMKEEDVLAIAQS